MSSGSQGLSTSPMNFLGVDNGAPRVYWYNLFQEGDDLTYVQGRHSVKMGADIRQIRDDEITSSNSRGNYTFLDIPGFLANTPIRFDAPAPGSNAYRRLRQTMFGAYVQDDFKVTPRLAVNMGLRWEAITDPKDANGKMANLLNLTDPAPTVSKDHFFAVTKKDFQPRVGFAWGLNGSGATVLRSGFGIFHDHILPQAYAGFASGTPPFFSTLSDLTNPVFPLDTNLTAGPAPPPQFGAFPATVKEPTKIQYNATVQQQVMKDTLVELAYIGSRSSHLQRLGGLNPPVAIKPRGFSGAVQPNERTHSAFASLTVFRFAGRANNK